MDTRCWRLCPRGCLLLAIASFGLTNLVASSSKSLQSNNFGESVILLSDEASFDAFQMPALVLEFSESLQDLDAQLADTWRRLGDWATVGVSVATKPGSADAAAPRVQCIQQGQQVINYEGGLELQSLQLFAAQTCRGVQLDRSAFAALEKYSANPGKHDTAFQRMVQQLTDASFASRTKARNAVVISFSAMCPLCKILRPAFNLLRAEPSLSRVAILALDAEKQKGNAAGLHVQSSPTVLFLHSGVVTSHFAVKPSKDTGRYAAELVAWAMRQNTMPELLVPLAAAAMEAKLGKGTLEKPGATKKPSKTPKESAFKSVFPELTEETLKSLGPEEGLVAIYHVASCWQCKSTYDQMWRKVEAPGGGNGLKASRHEMPMFPVHNKNPLGSHHCQEPFCVLYWRGDRPVARFSGPVTVMALQGFWRDMAALSPEQAAGMAEHMASDKHSHGGLHQEAKVVQHLKTKEHRVGAPIHTEL